MTTIDFVVSILDHILAVHGQSSSTSGFEQNAMMLGVFPPFARTITSLISQSPTNECAILLAGLVDHWFRCVAEKFPKTAMELLDAETQF